MHHVLYRIFTILSLHGKSYKFQSVNLLHKKLYFI